MKMAVLGALAGAVLVLATVAGLDQRNEVFGQRLAPYAAAPQPQFAGGDLIVLPMVGGDKASLLAVVDPRQQVLSVYHVDPTNGKISLRSVRNVHWDLQMTDFNGENPLPRDIRSLLEQR